MKSYVFIVMSNDIKKDIKDYTIKANSYQEAFDKVVAVSDAESPQDIHLMDVHEGHKNDNCFHWQQKDNVKDKFIFK